MPDVMGSVCTALAPDPPEAGDRRDIITESMKSRYDWTRYWHASGTEPRLTDDGFLYDPTSLASAMFGNKLFTLAELTDHRCLVLLGEPGTGKSTEVEAAYDSVRGALTGSNEAMFVQLRDVDSRAAFRDKVQDTAEFKAWVKGKHDLTLFLDSLDEGLLGFKPLSTTIAEFLTGLPIERLRLRLVSRTADWPQPLAHAITERWGAEGAQSLTLAPLRQEDVVSAAVAEGIGDPEQLWTELHDRDAGSLATRPVTLRLLLTIYLRRGSLPASRRELYDQGCLLLATEESESRKASSRIGSLEPDERLAIAGRVAFVLMMANRSAVWVDANYGNVPTTDVVLRDLLSLREETAGGIRYSIRAADIQEVLHCALFTSRGASRMSFAHRTLAEHLAGWYMAQHRIPWAQVRSLLFSSRAGEERVIPQLRETAARAAERGNGLLRRIAARDPDVLLKAVGVSSPTQRALIVNALLKRSRRDGVPASDSHDALDLSRLQHPRLVAQLEEVLINAAEHVEARRFAADLAAACGCVSLAKTLATIALDETLPFLLRYDALAAVYHLKDPAVSARLLPLALGNIDADGYDQLKGMALLLVWPDTLRADDLFPALTHPKRSNFYGPYESFIEELGPTLSPGDLPRALSWARQFAMDEQHLGRSVNGIMRRAWDHLTEKAVLDGFVAISYERLRHFRPIIFDERAGILGHLETTETPFENLLAGDATRRRLLASSLLTAAQDAREVRTLLHAEHALIRVEDCDWLLSKLVQTEGDGQRLLIIAAVRSLFFESGHSAVVFEKVYHAVQLAGQDDLRAEFSELLDGIALASARATELRHQHSEMEKWDRRDRRSHPTYPPAADEIVPFLDAFVKGDLTAWWRLCVYLGRNAEGTTEDSHYLAVDRQAGWGLLDADTKERIIAASDVYLHEQRPHLDAWVGTNNLYRPDIAGVRSLHLLQSADPSRLPSECDPVWSFWGPVLLEYSVYDNRDQSSDGALLARAFRAAPEVMLPALSRQITKDDRAGHGLWVLSRVKDALSTSLAQHLLSMLRANVLSARSTEELLLLLLEKATEGADAYAGGLLVLPLPSEDHGRTMTLVAARAILRAGSALGPTVVWPAMKSHAVFGQELVLSLAGSSDWLIPNVLSVWGEKRVGDLYIWLDGQFPATEDPNPEGSYSPWPRYNVGQWRRRLRTALENAGTWEAVAALERINLAIPSLTHAYALRSGREAAWRQQWDPPSAAQLLRVIADRGVRLVRDGDELVRLISASLARFQGELIGTTPLVRFLWFPAPRGKGGAKKTDANRAKAKHAGADNWKPRDEGDLADLIEQHLIRDLRNRGIVAGREVVIRRGAGDGVRGSRTDITVFAVVQGASENAFDSIMAILEIKCSWNTDLLTALDTQLVGDYLQNNQRAQHGVYVVGWFDSPLWDKRDQRRRRNYRGGMMALSKHIRKQARNASKPGIHVVADVLDASLRQNIERPDRRSRTSPRR
jgi:hypothetical protein